MGTIPGWEREGVAFPLCLFCSWEEKRSPLEYFHELVCQRTEMPTTRVTGRGEQLHRIKRTACDGEPVCP